MPDIRFVACHPRTMDAGLLTGADSDRLTVLRINDGIGLSIFRSDHRDQQIPLRALRQFLIFRHDILKQTFVNLHIVALLMETHAVNFLAFHRFRRIVRIHLQDQIGPLAFCA